MNINLNLLQTWLVGLAPWMIAFVVILLLDMGTGAAVAWKDNAFQVEKLPEVFKGGALYLVAWLSCEILFILPLVLNLDIEGYSSALADFAPKAVFAFIVVSKYLVSILAHVVAIRDMEHPVLVKLGIK